MSLDNGVTAHRHRTDTSNIGDARAERFPRGPNGEIKEKERGEGMRKERENKWRRATAQQSEEQVQRFRKAQQRGPLMAEAPLTVPVCSAQIPRAGRLCEATEDCQHPPSPASQPPSHSAANKPAAACFFARAGATKSSAGDLKLRRLRRRLKRGIVAPFNEAAFDKTLC